jgi:hypothetical protein
MRLAKRNVRSGHTAPLGLYFQPESTTVFLQFNVIAKCFGHQTSRHDLRLAATSQY